MVGEQTLDKKKNVIDAFEKLKSISDETDRQIWMKIESEYKGT